MLSFSGVLLASSVAELIRGLGELGDCDMAVFVAAAAAFVFLLSRVGAPLLTSVLPVIPNRPVSLWRLV